MILGHSSPTLCDPMDYNQDPPVHGVFQARVLEWVAISFSRVSSQLSDQTQVSCIIGRRFTVWASGEVHSTWMRGTKPDRVIPLEICVTAMWYQKLYLEFWFAHQAAKWLDLSSDYGPCKLHSSELRLKVNTEIMLLLLLFSHQVVSESLWPHGL